MSKFSCETCDKLANGDLFLPVWARHPEALPTKKKTRRNKVSDALSHPQKEEG